MAAQNVPAPLPRPGVQVIQQFRAVSPTIITPTLVPCVVGVGKQLVELLVDDGAGGQVLNSDALIQLPAQILAKDATGGPPVVYSGLNGLALELIVNNAPAVTITFSDAASAGLTPATVVSQINEALTTQGITSFIAETVGSTSFRIRTLGLGNFQSIVIGAGTDTTTVAPAFGIGVGRTYQGLDSYVQCSLEIPEVNFPDPRQNLDELSIEQDSIRAFIGTGGSGTNVQEALRTATFLRNGSVDTQAASAEGSVDLIGAYPAIATETLIIKVDGGATQTVTFASEANVDALLSAINGAITGAVASLGPANDGLVITSDTTGASSAIEILGGTANGLLGLSPGTVVGVSIQAVDDGNGDAVTPLLKFTGEDFTSASPQTKATATTDFSPTAVTDDNTLILKDGGTPQTIVFSGAVSLADIVTQINDIMSPAAGGQITASDVGGQLQLEHSLFGEDGVITIVGGTALPELDQSTAAALTEGTTDITLGGGVGTETLVVSIDDGAPLTITFATEVTVAALLLNINTVLGAAATASQGTGTNGLIITSNSTGSTSRVRLLADTGGAAVLGMVALEDVSGTDAVFAAGAEFIGDPFPPQAGDQLWVDGAVYATISEVAPGGNVDQLKVSTLVPIALNVGATFFIRAQNLEDPPLADRPIADFRVTAQNDVLVKNRILRTSTGDAVANVSTSVYLTYTAVRKDVTALAEDPGLLRFDDTVQLTDALEPITPDNPLGLGLFYALINAPGVQVTGLGVDATSADAPFGTVEAWTRAAEFLEGFEVYALGLLTHDETVAQVFNTHVLAMSEPEAKGERIVLWNPAVPTNELDTLVASGTDGDGLNTFTFDTKVTNLTTLVQQAGINPVGTIPVDEGLFLDISQDDKKYSIKSISGSQVTVRVTPGEFVSGENDDNFYSEASLPSPLISDIFSVRVRGAALLTVAGTEDKNAVAETVALLGQGFKNRRFWMTFPDKCAATIQGTELIIDGFYMNAATVGLIGQQPPQQSFTNFPVTGFTRVIGSNDKFSEPQLDQMAGGGAYIFIQEGANTPIFSRFAITTDLTSIETRTDSITKVVDFTAKFVRRSLRNFIGRFNITQGFLDSLSTTVDGLFGFLIEAGTLIGGSLDNIIQDEDQRDTVLIDTTIDVPVPCNFIKVTLLV